MTDFDKFHAMKSGSYTLTQEVPNPAKDGRRSDWYSAPTLRPGRYFVRVRSETNEIAEGRTMTSTSFYIARGEFAHQSGRIADTLHGDSWAGEGSAAAIVPFLEPDHSLESALLYAEHEDYVHPVDVLTRLVRAGAVSEDAVRVAIDAQREADEARAEREELQAEMARKEAANV